MNEKNRCQLRVDGRTSIIEVHGRLDFNHHGEFRQTMEAALAMDAVNEFVVDLRHADYLDSSALGALLNFNDAAEAKRKRVVLANASGLPRQILDIARFDAVFEIR